MAAVRPIDAFWSDFFGVEPAALAEPGLRVVSHRGLAGYSGVWFFVREGACLVSSPADWLDRLREAVSSRSLESILSPEGLDSVFGAALGATVGPAWHGYLDAAPRVGPAADPVRELAPCDADAVARLGAACDPADAAAASLDVDAPGGFGWFEGERLLAAATLSPWASGVVGPGALTHPEQRRRGLATAVVGAAAAGAFARGQLVVYQTLMENDAARGVARRLGFSAYASHLAVRLAPGSPHPAGRP